MLVRILLLGLLACVSASAQTLADVLSSIQERKQALEQREQVKWHVNSNYGGAGGTLPAQNLIQWEGLGTTKFPTDADTAALSIDQRIAALNQAVDEMRSIQRQYLNIRREDIAAAQKIGAMRPYLLEDFPDFGRVGASNYHTTLRGLAACVRRLTVLEWPFAGFKKTAHLVPEYDENNPNPSSIGPAPVIGGSGTWETTANNVMLEECLLNYDNLFSETVFFYEKVALFAAVPSAADQLDGNVGVIIRNQWSPIDFSQCTVVAPNSWDPRDGSCQVAMVQNSASGDNFSMGAAPQITIPVNWTVGPGWNPDGFPYPKDYPVNDEFGGISEDEWESKLNIWFADTSGGGGEYYVLGRRLHSLFTPTFTKGLDATGKAANLNLAEKASAGPSGDAKPLLHPAPGILAAIPLGVGLDGGVAGMLGITHGDEFDPFNVPRKNLISYSYETPNSLIVGSGYAQPEVSPHYWELPNRFDFAGNLRFIGPAQDFHVVYETSREVAARGVDLPDLPPTNTEETNIGCRFFFRNWDLPRIKQVVSRDFIVNIKPLGYYKNEVKIYRLPLGHVVNRTPGKAIEIGTGQGQLNLTAIRTLIFDNPDAGANAYPNSREKVHITDDTTTYKVWRTGDTNGDGTDDGYPYKVPATGGVIPADLHFEVNDGTAARLQEQFNFSGEGDVDITTHLDGTLLSTQSIDDDDWYWYLRKEPNVRTFVNGTRTITVTNTFDGAEPVGSQSGWYPASVQITDTNESTIDLAWNTSGRMTSQSQGDWSVTYTSSALELKAVSEFKGASGRYATNWTDWSADDLTITSYSAPDGGVTNKTDPKVAKTVLNLGDTSGTELPGLPYTLYHADDDEDGQRRFTKWDWSVDAADHSGSLIVESGKFDGLTLKTGYKQATAWNSRGYTVSSETTRSINGASVITAKFEVPNDQFTNWAAPKQWKDTFTGLVTQFTYEGVGQNEMFNRLSSVISPLGLTTDFGAYDVFDRATQIVSNGITANHTFTGLGGSTAYQGTGVQSGSASSYLPNVEGTSVSCGSIWAGLTKDLTVTRGTTGISYDLDAEIDTNKELNINTVLRKNDGSLNTSSGDGLAFGGVNGDEMSVTNGLFVRKSKVADQPGTYVETRADAWGRVHTIETPSKKPGETSITTYEYSLPSEVLKRVVINYPTEHVLISESDADDTIFRTGFRRDTDDELGGGQDRYTESITTIESGVIVTVHKITEDNGKREFLRTELVPDSDPASSDAAKLITKINGNEEQIEQTISFPNDASTSAITTSSDKGWNGTQTIDKLGLVVGNELSGTGVTASETVPTWRADGSMASITLTIDGKLHTATFDEKGFLTSLKVPADSGVHPGGRELLGAAGHEIIEENGVLYERIQIDGATYKMALDGTDFELSGGDTMGRRETLTKDGTTGFEKTTTPDGGAPTHEKLSLAMAPTDKTYADASGLSITYTKDLPTAVSLARGGAMALGYSNDGAKDLLSAVWPQVVSGEFTIDPVGQYYTHTRSGKVKTTTDPSGIRTHDYQNGRRVSSLYTAGALNGYAVISARDSSGRHIGTTVNRDNNTVHATATAYNGASDQIANVSVSGITAIPQRDSQGYITGYVWSDGSNTVTQNWVRGPGGLIYKAHSDVPNAPSFTYLLDNDPQNYAQSFDGRNRRLICQTEGDKWDYAYGAGGQLSIAAHPTLGTFNYYFDGMGRRTVEASPNPEHDNFNNLNQTTNWINSQNKTLTIKAHPNARVWYNGVEIQNFTGTHQVAITPPGPNGGWVQWETLAILEDAGDGFGNPAPNPLADPDAKAEQKGAVWVPPTSETLAYDLAGNRQSSAQWDFGWDAKNQLVRVRSKSYDTAAQGFDLTFTYDAEGRRVAKHVITYQNGVQVAEKTVTFIWDGWDLLYERHQLPSGLTLLERKYLWGPDLADGAAGGAGGLLLIRETKGSATSEVIPLYDGTGHVVALTDINKNLLASYGYGPFGEKISAEGPKANGNPWRWATKYLDEETGLYYFGHRYYDPITGQWLSREPLGESESVNLYAYAGNDPINHVDVLGLAKVATDGRGNLTEAGLRIIEVAKQDPKAARSMLMALQVSAEIEGTNFGKIFGNGSKDSIAAVRDAIEGVAVQADLDGRREWSRINAEAGLSGESGFNGQFKPALAALNAHFDPVIAQAQRQHDINRFFERAGADIQTEFQNSFGYKFVEFADAPMHVGTAIGSGLLATDVTTGTTLTWNGWANGWGFGLQEVSPGERVFAAALIFIPGAIDDIGGRFGDDLVRVGAKNPAWQATPGRIGRFTRIETPWSRSVWQRSDIDWSLMRPDGLTNLEAARGGHAPLRSIGDGFEGVQLHHLNQRVDGGLAEVWASTHRRVNHNVPAPSWRVTNPDAAAAFRRETPAYWRWRARQIDGQ